MSYLREIRYEIVLEDSFWVFRNCPKCGRKEGDGGIGFQRIRRITGYLVGTLERFNNAKRAEVRDRVKHSIVAEVKLTPKENA